MRLEKSSLASDVLFCELPFGGLSLGVRWPTTVGRLRYCARGGKQIVAC